VNAILAVGAGGAAGSVLRYLLTGAVQRFAGQGFPAGTVVVNVLGSFAIGLLYVWLVERGASAGLRALLMAGFLGGFTTFSSFSLETVNLMMQASYGRAALNVLLSVALCIGGTMLGIALARQY
jgi:fluoride exporter